MAEHVMTLALQRLLVDETLKHGDLTSLTPNRLPSLARRLASSALEDRACHGPALADFYHATSTPSITVEPFRSQWKFIGTAARFRDVLRASDVVVIQLPLTRATRGLIGKDPVWHG